VQTIVDVNRAAGRITLAQAVTVTVGEGIKPDYLVNADMTDRMLPMEVLAPDGSLFITRQATPEHAALVTKTGASAYVTVNSAAMFVPGMTVMFVDPATGTGPTRLVLNVNPVTNVIQVNASVAVAANLTLVRSTSVAPESGIWVLSTATRDLWPSYPLDQPEQAIRHDLYLQTINVPVPDK